MKYYQHKNQNPSYQVWYSYNKCLKDNNCEMKDLRAFIDDEIESPQFMDVDIFKCHEIKDFLNTKIMYNKLDEVKNFLERNKKGFHEGMTKFLGYSCTDSDTNQYVKKMSDSVFFIIENNKFHSISLSDYSKEQLEEYVSSYYNNLDHVKEEYGKKWKQIVAEIISENN